MHDSRADHHGVPCDAVLIGRSLQGDDATFIEVVRRHERPVSAYLVRRVGAGPAEDLLGEVWVEAFAARRSYDHAFADARPWLFGIARNVLRAYWRRAPREVLAAELGEFGGDASPWPDVDGRIDAAARCAWLADSDRRGCAPRCRSVLAQPGSSRIRPRR